MGEGESEREKESLRKMKEIKKGRGRVKGEAREIVPYAYSAPGLLLWH